MVADKASAEPKSQPWFAFEPLRVDPLVTFSSAEVDRIPLLALAEALPARFEAARALHLLHLTNTLERSGAASRLAAEIARAEAAMPGHAFVPLTATEQESYNLAAEGVPSLLGSGLIFVDERNWKPSPPLLAGLRVYDAVYSARLATGKRHELAAEVESLMLVYPHAIERPNDEAYEQVRTILPNAYFVNHEAGKGRYRHFNAATMAGILAHARVGLCLTSVEGCMRASMEYLLCGLPIVSTRSIGGRDRYFLGRYCRIVDDDPSAVADAVRTLVKLGLDRRRIRSHVAELLTFDRYNFLLNVNKIGKSMLGIDELLPKIDPLIGAISKFRRLDDVVAKARIQFRHADIAAGAPVGQ